MRARRACLSAAALIVFWAAPAAAGALFEAPAGCETYLTTQNRSCLVVNHYMCPGIDADDRWSHRIRRGQPAHVSRIDEEAQWIESGPEHDTAQIRTLRPIPDPGSLTELVETGIDTYDFYQRPVGGMPLRITGFDRVIGEVEVDGEPLLQTEFEATYRDWKGEVIRHVKGEEYVSVTHRRFFGGTLVDIRGGREIESEARGPVEFLYPGDAGFRAMDPRHDCDVLSGVPRSGVAPVAGAEARGQPLALSGIFGDRRNEAGDAPLAGAPVAAVGAGASPRAPEVFAKPKKQGRDAARGLA